MMTISNAASHVEADPKAELAKKMEAVRRITRLSAKELPKWTYCIWLLALASFCWMGLALARVIPTQGPLEGVTVSVLCCALLPLGWSYLVTLLYVKACSAEHTDMAEVFVLLEQYDPVDKQAYKALQEETRKAGRLEEDNVKAWAKAETEAIERGPLGPEADGFLNKKV